MDLVVIGWVWWGDRGNGGGERGRLLGGVGVVRFRLEEWVVEMDDFRFVGKWGSVVAFE